MRALGIKDDNAFAEYLLVEAGVAVVPGSGFGAPGHMRISFACSMKTLEDALAASPRRVGGERRRAPEAGGSLPAHRDRQVIHRRFRGNQI
jgi:hypothetical protein